jgi:hypothetical protein
VQIPARDSAARRDFSAKIAKNRKARQGKSFAVLGYLRDLCGSLREIQAPGDA